MKSTEQRVNQIREWLIESVLDLAEFQTNSNGGAPELEAAANKLENVIIEFERVVDETTKYQALDLFAATRDSREELAHMIKSVVDENESAFCERIYQIGKTEAR